VQRLAEGLAARGHAVEVWCHQPISETTFFENPDGVVVRRFPLLASSQHYAASIAMARALWSERRDFDLVHSHNYHSLVPLFSSISTCAPLIFTPHYHGTSDSALRRKLHYPYHIAGSFIGHKASAIICVSTLEAELFTSHFPRTRTPVTVIPNGVDGAALASAMPFDVTDRVILSAGRLEFYKQVDRVVDAVLHLPAQYSLVVVGGGPARAGLESKIAELGLQRRVRMLGRLGIDELRRWFRTAEVFVSMSQIEAMPITPLELLYCGARVVASDIPAHQEVARVTGGYVALVPFDASAPHLARCIEDASNSPMRAASVSTWDEVVERTIALYARTLPV
jgi:glycosyltransferase involved in cell wall biosynthesis